MIVGGTALAGYYAGHRKSDDLDLFASDTAAHRATTLAARSLRDVGTQITEVQNSNQFYSGSYRLDGHDFTVQVVLDPHLFEIGVAIEASDGVRVADLETLLKLKAATLLSRCSEKDLYDLKWLFGEFSDLTVEALIALGSEVDGGMNAETALTSVVGTSLSPSACGFSLSQSREEVFQDVESLRMQIADALDKVARKQPVPAIGELIRRLKR